MQLTKNFKLKEFDCKDGTKVPAIYLQNIKEIARRLEIIRRGLKDTPLKINSGYRTRTWNMIVGGVRNSQHLEGMAADIKSIFTAEEVYNKIIELTENGKLPDNGMVKKYKSFVHYDIRKNNKLIKL